MGDNCAARARPHDQCVRFLFEIPVVLGKDPKNLGARMSIMGRDTHEMVSEDRFVDL